MLVHVGMLKRMVTNAPITFMDLMKRACWACVEYLVIVFIVKFIIYLKSEEEHKQYTQEVLDIK